MIVIGITEPWGESGLEWSNRVIRVTESAVQGRADWRIQEE